MKNAIARYVLAFLLLLASGIPAGCRLLSDASGTLDTKNPPRSASSKQFLKEQAILQIVRATSESGHAVTSFEEVGVNPESRIFSLVNPILSSEFEMNRWEAASLIASIAFQNGIVGWQYRSAKLAELYFTNCNTLLACENFLTYFSEFTRIVPNVAVPILARIQESVNKLDTSQAGAVRSVLTYKLRSLQARAEFYAKTALGNPADHLAGKFRGLSPEEGQATQAKFDALVNEYHTQFRVISDPRLKGTKPALLFMRDLLFQTVDDEYPELKGTPKLQIARTVKKFAESKVEALYLDLQVVAYDNLKFSYYTRRLMAEPDSFDAGSPFPPSESLKEFLASLKEETITGTSNPQIENVLAVASMYASFWSVEARFPTKRIFLNAFDEYLQAAGPILQSAAPTQFDALRAIARNARASCDVLEQITAKVLSEINLTAYFPDETKMSEKYEDFVSFDYQRAILTFYATEFMARANRQVMEPDTDQDNPDASWWQIWKPQSLPTTAVRFKDAKLNFIDNWLEFRCMDYLEHQADRVQISPIVKGSAILRQFTRDKATVVDNTTVSLFGKSFNLRQTCLGASPVKDSQTGARYLRKSVDATVQGLADKQFEEEHIVPLLQQLAIAIQIAWSLSSWNPALFAQSLRQEIGVFTANTIFRKALQSAATAAERATFWGTVKTASYAVGQSILMVGIHQGMIWGTSNLVAISTGYKGAAMPLVAEWKERDNVMSWFWRNYAGRIALGAVMPAFSQSVTRYMSSLPRMQQLGQFLDKMKIPGRQRAAFGNAVIFDLGLNAMLGGQITIDWLLSGDPASDLYRELRATYSPNQVLQGFAISVLFESMNNAARNHETLANDIALEDMVDGAAAIRADSSQQSVPAPHTGVRAPARKPPPGVETLPDR